MFRKGIAGLYLLCCGAVTNAGAQESAYTLGSGLFLPKGATEPLSWTDTLPVYYDSALTRIQTNLTVEQTNCPRCMACAEPQSYYAGRFRPFICGGGNGPAFICTRVGKAFYEIITDTTGSRAYIPLSCGTYLSWGTYVRKEAKRGEYFRITRPADSTILYDKPYAFEALPGAAPSRLSAMDLSAYRFYPVAVQGNWLKLRAVRGGKITGYCWIIWRSDNRLYKWFAWHAD